MATAELSVFHGALPIPIPRTSAPSSKPLHRIQQVRMQQGMSLRTAARQLETDVRSIRAQEEATSDLRLSDLYRWQEALEVPVAELLQEGNDPLSRPVAERAKMVRIMKTAAAILESAPSPALHRMAENLVDQLIDIMPELKEVSPWHSVGQRRGTEELGRIAENIIDDSSLGGGELYD